MEASLGCVQRYWANDAWVNFKFEAIGHLSIGENARNLSSSHPSRVHHRRSAGVILSTKVSRSLLLAWMGAYSCARLHAFGFADVEATSVLVESVVAVLHLSL